jgi:ectoine hydroxylase-related dioxygenase (phytanoyl-CoA dioxygenase family)
VHLLGFVSRDEVFLELLDLAPAFDLVCRVLGWNIHMYHCHLDAHPRVAPRPPRWGWHQDGGRQNLELGEGAPRPRMSLKVAYFLTDVDRPGTGNMLVIPGSHRRDTLARPAAPGEEAPEPAGAVPLLASAGDAVVFDRRIWHSRSANVAGDTRRALFLAYTYRWVRPRDAMPIHPAWWRRLSPVRRQLLGEATDEVGRWIPTPDDVPLREAMAELGLLDRAVPAHR